VSSAIPGLAAATKSPSPSVTDPSHQAKTSKTVSPSPEGPTPDGVASTGGAWGVKKSFLDVSNVTCRCFCSRCNRSAFVIMYRL
jgi:hypothetical protein